MEPVRWQQALSVVGGPNMARQCQGETALPVSAVPLDSPPEGPLP